MVSISSRHGISISILVVRGSNFELLFYNFLLIFISYWFIKTSAKQYQKMSIGYYPMGNPNFWLYLVPDELFRFRFWFITTLRHEELFRAPWAAHERKFCAVALYRPQFPALAHPYAGRSVAQRRTSLYLTTTTGLEISQPQKSGSTKN